MRTHRIPKTLDRDAYPWDMPNAIIRASKSRYPRPNETPTKYEPSTYIDKHLYEKDERRKLFEHYTTMDLTIWIFIILIPLATFIILWMLKPSFVQNNDGNVDVVFLIIWTLVICVIGWVILFSLNNCRCRN
jgi:magnesium-transporting ATPase (P-type)